MRDGVLRVQTGYLWLAVANGCAKLVRRRKSRHPADAARIPARPLAMAASYSLDLAPNRSPRDHTASLGTLVRSWRSRSRNRPASANLSPRAATWSVSKTVLKLSCQRLMVQDPATLQRRICITPSAGNSAVCSQFRCIIRHRRHLVPLFVV